MCRERERDLVFSACTSLLLVNDVTGGSGRGGGPHALHHSDAVFRKAGQTKLRPLTHLQTQQLLKASQCELHTHTYLYTHTQTYTLTFIHTHGLL